MMKGGYSIGVVAKMLGVTQQTLRMYEQRGLINPARTPGHTRLYDDEDIKTIKFIHQLTRELGVNLAGVEIILRMKNRLKRVQEERDELLCLVYEAMDMITELNKNTKSSMLPVKSRSGHLVKWNKIE